ncbi:MAG: choice-of-anchor D domain-containing protein [Myxococcales bacterium]|nr:choice-of-anchor D domain-containing protein [Myxococcales bacterium]
MKPSRVCAALSVVSFVASGCASCGRDHEGIEKSVGEIGVVHEQDGVQVPTRDASYEFGSVFAGQTHSLRLVVRNLGRGFLTLEALEKESGAPVQIGAAGDPDAVFEIAFEPRRLGASDVVEYDMLFRAPLNDSSQVAAFEARLILRASNTAPGGESATITLTAKSVPGQCELPTKIDFGSVARGDTWIAGFPLANLSRLETQATVGDLQSSFGDHLAFAFSATSARGTVPLPSGTTRQVELAFTPTEARSYLAFVRVRASIQCPELVVSLAGTGVDSVLTWAPQTVDFGYVSPGVEVTRQLVFTNSGNSDAEISQLRSLSAEFRVISEPGQDPTRLTVPGKGGTAKLGLGFKPTVLGPRATQLTFTTDLPKQRDGRVQLQGYGGGPDIQISPAPLPFGKVAYFAGVSPPSFQTRKLTVLNVGTRPAVPDPNANLKLLPHGDNGAAWKVVAVGAGSDRAELEVSSGPYDPAVGLEASAGKNFVDLTVKLTPSSLGPKEFLITIFSNDPDEPETRVTVTADVVQLPPCQYSVAPTALNFGLVTPPNYRDLTFTIKNLGLNPAEICLVSNLDLGAGSDPAFSLPAGPVSSKELQPGESMQVLLRASPQGPVPTAITPAKGTAEFFASSPTVPQRIIPLEAAVAGSCLSISPDDLDFGTVQKGCNSQTQGFAIYNNCASAVTVTSIAMQAAAGQPAGGPDCPGTSPCAEFFLTQVPLIPSGGLSVAPGAAPTSFAAKYRPIDIGFDSGAIAIGAVQGGQNVTYVVTLAGEGDTAGLNTEVFNQSSAPKADILLVIDNSGSMYDEQQALASNFDAFIKYAVGAKVDYHLAVTTTDMDPGGEQGQFVSGASHPEKILKPTTASVESKFKAKVAVGTNGSATEMCFEPALRALTPPLISDPSQNGGFLRREASLAIVCVSDELEQSPQPATYYYNQFLNIKGAKNANMLTVNAIAGMFTSPPAGCSAVPDDGRYGWMVSQTNGLKESICTPNWSKTLERLGTIASGFRTNFFLKATPDLTGGKTIRVAIDGVPISSVDARGSTVWAYDPVANSVNFEPLFVPEPGRTIGITYYVACL